MPLDLKWKISIQLSKNSFPLFLRPTHTHTDVCRRDLCLSSYRMELATQVQIPDEDVCMSYITDNLDKGMNLFIFLRAMGK